MLEARFVSLNPIMQQMFLKLHEVEDDEKRDFILETLLKFFRDVVIEARKVFDRFKMLGSCVDVIGTLEKIDKTKPENREEIKIPIPFFYTDKFIYCKHLFCLLTASTVLFISLQTNISFHTIRLILCFQQNR